MKRCTWMLCISAGLLVCGVAAAEPIVMAKPVPYAEDAAIAMKIKNECQIQDQLADYIAEYAREQHLEVTFTNTAQSDAAGLVLDVHIKDAVSLGNPFTGHRRARLRSASSIAMAS